MKQNLINMVFLLIISLMAEVVHNLLFGLSGFGFVVFFQALVIYGLMFSLNKYFLVFVFFIEFFVLVFLFAYHQYFDMPINWLTIKTQYKEGIDLLFRNYEKIFNLASLALFVCFVIKSVFVLKYYQAKKINLLFAIPLLVFVVINYSNFYRQVYYVNNYNNYAKTFGYLHALIYEKASDFNAGKVEEEVLSYVPKEVEIDYSLSKTKNIYVIQVESLDYMAINEQNMPFMNSLKEKAIFYKILPHRHLPSGNSDFMVLSLTSYDFVYALIYPLVNEDVYLQIESLPQMMKKMGYHTSFYHGNDGDYYERYRHAKAMGFDKIIFEEDLSAYYPSRDWGIDDANMFDYILSQSGEFRFVISLSSHSPFSIANIHQNPHKNPKTNEEKYFNSVNYFDQALQNLITNSEDDALFFIYSDHQSEALEDDSTVLIIYDKQKDISLQKEISFEEVPQIIKQNIINMSKQ